MPFEGVHEERELLLLPTSEAPMNPWFESLASSGTQVRPNASGRMRNVAELERAPPTPIVRPTRGDKAVLRLEGSPSLPDFVHSKREDLHPTHSPHEVRLPAAP